MASSDIHRHDDLPLNLVEAAGLAATRISDDVVHLERLALLGTLTASIAHEVNNLLTPAMGAAQLLAERPDVPESARRSLDRMVHAMRSASKISEAILGFARPTGAAQNSSVKASLDQAILCIDPRGGTGTTKHGVIIESSVDPTIWVAMSPLALQQVFVNLILNALAALRGRKGKISIQAERLPSDQVQIQVSDNGHGIPPKRLATLFRPFSGGEGAPSGVRAAEAPAGTGLGLSVCRHLLQQSHGDIAVASEHDRGTTFTITLPTATIAPSSQPRQRGSEDAPDPREDSAWRQGAA